MSPFIPSDTDAVSVDTEVANMATPEMDQINPIDVTPSTPQILAPSEPIPDIANKPETTLPKMALDGGAGLTPNDEFESDANSESEDREQAKPVDKYFTDGTVPRALSPIISESDSDVRQTISMHRDSDLYIQAKNEHGTDIVFEVNSSVLAATSPVFRKMIYGTSHRPDTGDWIIDLSVDNAKALRHVFRIIHFRCNTRDVMRMRTPDEIGQILLLVHKYELDNIIYPFAKKWSGDLTHALQLDEKTHPDNSVQALWIAWKIGDFKNFRDLLVDVIFWACDKSGALCGPDGKPLEGLPWPKELLDVIESNRLEALRRILATFSDPINYFMSPNEKPNGRYCKSIDNQVECHCTLLGSAITALNKAGMWPLPKPEKYGESIYRLRQIVDGLHITALLYPGHPPHEQRHLRCGLEHKDVLEELKSFVPVLPDALLKEMKHRGQMMLTFDEEAWAPYKDQDKWEDVDLEPEDPVVDDGWDETE